MCTNRKDIYNQKWLKRFGISAITINQWVIYSMPKVRIIDRLKRHEEEHRKQFEQDGVIKFLAKYFAEYLRNRILYRQSHWQAYLNISYEIQARKAEQY